MTIAASANLAAIVNGAVPDASKVNGELTWIESRALDTAQLIAGAVVGATGAISRGLGFTSLRTSTGFYTVTLTTAMGTIYSAVGASQAATPACLVAASILSSTQVEFRVFTTGGALTDVSFYFMIVGL